MIDPFSLVAWVVLLLKVYAAGFIPAWIVVGKLDTDGKLSLTQHTMLVLVWPLTAAFCVNIIFHGAIETCHRLQQERKQRLAAIREELRRDEELAKEQLERELRGEE